MGVYVDDNEVLPSLPKKIIPLMRVETFGHYTDDQINSKFGTLISGLRRIRNLRISFLVIGGVFGVLAVVLGIVYCCKRKKEENEERPLNDSVLDTFEP